MIADYERQVYTAMLGKVIGVYLGRPFEGWTKRNIEARWGQIDRYVHADQNVPLVVADDDISGTFTFIKILADSGCYVETPDRLYGENWLNYLLEGQTVLWWGGVSQSTEHTAFSNLKRGIGAPESGSMRRNGREVSEQIGAQIFIDAFGMVAPGRPELAVRLAEKAARVSHDGEAVHAARVVAAMVSLAFVTKEMARLLDEAVAWIPPESLIAQVHRDVRAWAAADGDWRRTFARIEERYGYTVYGGNCHIVPNHALMVMAWAYAGNDFFKALQIVCTAGWDTDCNAANVGCVSALVAGLDHLGDTYDFRTPFADRLLLPTADGTDSVTDVLRHSRIVAAIGRRVMQAEPAPAPKGGALHHFEMQGAVHGYQRSAGRARAVNVAASVGAAGTRALGFGFGTDRAAPARIATPLLAVASERTAYTCVSTPLLYNGMTVQARLHCQALSAPATLRLYVRTTEDVLVYSAPVALRAGASATLSWIVEAGWAPLHEFGLEAASEEPCEGEVVVDYVATNGAAIYPYDTAPKAARHLQDALDAVYADDAVQGTVNVAAGTWKYTGSDVSGTFTPWLLVNKAVNVVGPEANEAKFNADRKIMTMFLFHPRAVLERITISNGRLNQSTAYGASLNMMAGLVTNCVVSLGFCNYGGNATIRGGSIWNSQFLNGTLTPSGEDRPGGGLQVYAGVTVANCLFANNSGGYGGGFFMQHANAVVSNSVVRNNTGGICGGAGVGLAAGLVTHCIITNNTSDKGGGGVRVSGGTLRNCLVANNRANSMGSPLIGYNGAGGGGIAMNNGIVENCTIAHNTSASSTRCDELYQTDGTVQNCIFLGKDGVAANDVYKTSGTARYSFFRTPITGTGNLLGDDAKIAAPASGDFTLMYGSPCIDTGMVITAVSTDLRGLARPIGEKYDLGCYEMDFSGMMVASFDADVTSGGGDIWVTLTATVVGGTAPYTYGWLIGGVLYETSAPTYSHLFGYGSHDITLRVTDSEENTTGDVTREALVVIRSPVVHVSEHGSGTWPFDTWERATSNWNAAVGAVYATEETPGRIWVADGHYKAMDTDVFTADLSQPIDFAGTNPACKAVFDGLNTLHPVVKINHAKSRLRNVAIKNTRAGYIGNCGAIWLYEGLVSNCVAFADNGYENGTGGGAVRVSGGMFCDSVLSNFNAATHSGGDRFGGGLYITGGTAERLLISGCIDGHGGGAYVSGTTAVLRDSVIRRCYTSSGGAVYIDAGLVENCIITNNTGNGRKSDANVFTDYPGAGAYVAGGTLRNCLLSNNRCDTTYVGWDATQAGLYVAGGQAYNNTVWANLLKSGVTNDVYVKGGTVANTIAYAYSNHNGTAECNFTGADPLFKRAGEFILVGSSPCVNAGANSYWEAEEDTAIDLAGFKRVRLSTVDIGAYEYQSDGLMFLLR